MRGPPSASVRVFRELYPNAEPNDPDSLQEYGEYFLVPELRVELDLFYGALDKNDPCQRKARRPGIDYNDKGWRIRMSKWYYHAELFQIFDKLGLRSRDIDEVCTWWGSKAEVAAFEEVHPGMVLGDDIWDGIPVAPRMDGPVAIFHDPSDAPLPPPPPPPRKRSSRLRRMIPRPRAIRGWTDLQRGSSSRGPRRDGAHEQDAVMLEPPSPDEGDIIERSVGVPLNHNLRSGGQSPAFEEWFKDEYESGHGSSIGSSSRAHAPTYQQPHPRSHPFQVSTNTISYRATPHHSMAMPSYTQRMMSAHRSMSSVPVAVNGMPDATPRSSQARQSSLGRYSSMPRQYQYRPIRPRPLRQPSRG